jgi:hypothetical protein
MNGAVDNKASNNDAKPQRDNKKEFRRRSGNEQAKGNGQQNGRDSPQNGRHHDKNQKQAKQGNEKKPPVNERFDNSALLAADGAQVQDPAFSLKISESKRINDIITPGLPQEVTNKVKQIQEMFPNYEFHFIYTVLENSRFDEQEAINRLAELKPDQSPKPQQQRQKAQQQQNKPIKDQLAQTPWASVVKGPQAPQPPQHQPQHQPQQQHQQPQHQPQHQQPQQYVQPVHQPQPQAQPQHQPQYQQPIGQPTPQQQVFGFGNPMLQGLMPLLGGLTSNSEDVVQTLSSAISEQLQTIMEKTKQLMAMQDELQKITQNDKTEMQQLQDRKAHLEDEQRRLHEQLHQNKVALAQVEEQIAAKGREKVVALQSLTAKSAELGVVEIPRYASPSQIQPDSPSPAPAYQHEAQNDQSPQAQHYQAYNGQNGQGQRKTQRCYPNNANGNSNNNQQFQNRGAPRQNRY